MNQVGSLLTPIAPQRGTTAAGANTAASNVEDVFGLVLQQAEASFQAESTVEGPLSLGADATSIENVNDAEASGIEGRIAENPDACEASVDPAPVAKTLPVILSDTPTMWQRPEVRASALVQSKVSEVSAPECADLQGAAAAGADAETAHGAVRASATIGSILTSERAAPAMAAPLVAQTATADTEAPTTPDRASFEPAAAEGAEQASVLTSGTGAGTQGETRSDVEVTAPASRAGTAAVAPFLTPAPAVFSALAPPDVTTSEFAGVPHRAVAAQVAPAIMSIVQRPAGSHQLTMTISPETLGPVTIRAHITGGDVRVELISGTDAGREALRTIVVDLRRDLAAVMPSAQLSLGANPTSDLAGNERGGNERGGYLDADGTSAGGSDDERSSGRGRAGEIPVAESADRTHTAMTMNLIGTAPSAGLDTFA